MKEIMACGSWDSPIGSEDLVRGALRLSAPRIEGGRIFWLEGRPNEGGRQVVLCTQLSQAPPFAVTSEVREVSPPGVNVRTRVHEYGGGEYAIWRDRIFFVDDADGRIFMANLGGVPIPLTPSGSQYADLVVSPDGAWLFAVEEQPCPRREPENRLVAISLGNSNASVETTVIGAPRVIASGHDFYASPTIAPRGDRIAFLAWDHPNMPWNGTFLECLDWGQEGAISPVRRVAGSASESLFQPRFSADGTLFVVSDRSGWWNLVRLGEGEPVPVHSLRAELGRPQWVFGQSSWCFLDSQVALASATVAGEDVLLRIDLERGTSEEIPTSFRSVGGIQSEGGWATCIAGSAAESSALYAWRSDTHQPELLRKSAPFEIPENAISVAVPRVFASVEGRETHAFVYLPRSAKHGIRSGELPPLLVKSHGGPTSATASALDPRIQFWTTRGFAVADVNYAGSTGYGRAYRDQLEGRWGVVDVEDCVAVALSLAEEGLVDRDRLAISGGSAGGYTTLCALTFHDVFAAGASHYGIGDLEALARDTHKFESRYTDWLVGPLPEMRDRYIERSPVHHPDRLGCPMIFFQGLEDKVVPPNQAEAMIAVLAKRGIPHAYVPFEGEQHGFRRAENIRTALDGELYFYSRVFGFEAPQPAGVDVVTAAIR